MLSEIIIQNILIFLAESFWIFSTLSQLIKLIRTKDTKGLYAPTLVLNAGGNIAWMMYFISHGLLVPFCTNIIMVSLTMVMIGYLLLDKRKIIKAIISICIVGPIAAFLIIKFPDFSGWTGMIFNTIAATPWLIHVVVTKKTSGLSERSLYFAYGAMICTLIYASMIGSPPLISGCLRGLTYSFIITIFYYKYRNR